MDLDGRARDSSDEAQILCGCQEGFGASSKVRFRPPNAIRCPTKRIYQYGPNCVRDSRDLRAALGILAERGRARLQEDGRRRVIAINPALLLDQS